jgi:hypothetical protein
LETPISERPDFTVYLNYLDAVKDTPNGILLNNNGNLLPVAGGRKSFLGFGSPEGDQQLLLGTLKVDHVISSSLSLSAALQLRHNERENNLNFYDSFGFSPERNVNAKACALCIWFVCEQILSQWFGLDWNFNQLSSRFGGGSDRVRALKTQGVQWLKLNGGSPFRVTGGAIWGANLQLYWPS